MPLFLSIKSTYESPHLSIPPSYAAARLLVVAIPGETMSRLLFTSTQTPTHSSITNHHLPRRASSPPEHPRQLTHLLSIVFCRRVPYARSIFRRGHATPPLFRNTHANLHLYLSPYFAASRYQLNGYPGGVMPRLLKTGAAMPTHTLKNVPYHSLAMPAPTLPETPNIRPLL